MVPARTLLARLPLALAAVLAATPADAAPPPARAHWSFRPGRPTPPPTVRNSAWPRTSIDPFVLARLEALGLAPAPPADRRTLLRRLTFDLTGLPPSPEEIEAFLADGRPDAYERVVERLLGSPHHGERWGRHWLDVARYADTAGETADFPAAHAWRYRNWVLDSVNADQPYDEFVREQIAGDILAAAGPAERRAGRIVATGYLAVARRFGYDIDQDHYLTIEDTIDTLGKSILGLTLGCARCHDHMYDPVSMKDYYALYGIFQSTRYPFPGCEKDKRPRGLVSLAPGALAYAVADGTPADTRLHKRGNPQLPGPAVPRRFLTVLGGQVVPPGSGSGRLQLAQWLTEPANPLTARVMVNRLWHHHLGRGLVATADDLGTRGSPPSHSELLDYLAARFVESGWSVKAMHRLIVLSATYRQSGQASAEARRQDPDNVWLSRFAPRRLGAEEVRDAILAASDDLDRRRGGPHPFPAENTWGFTQHNPFRAVYDHDRRSVYLMTQRIKRHPFLGLFDGADPNASTAKRDVSTAPPQALFFLNDPFVHAKSASLARRLLSLPAKDRLDRLFALCYARLPTARERAVAERFLEGDAPARWAGWVRVLMASNEFVYVD